VRLVGLVELSLQIVELGLEERARWLASQFASL